MLAFLQAFENIFSTARVVMRPSLSWLGNNHFDWLYSFRYPSTLRASWYQRLRESVIIQLTPVTGISPMLNR